ncbi:VOC family protein [Paenibacillus harenae]|uniref:Catechol 2,3-dioxygenase-like lactoylglutathione lyase family enzyme n=1 Tax=Paenibacillus harenae TaxID=306543 RepID=A0ABT9U6A0_PAEHA|nr:VOC family protein [Paenibacillus harenae]MDQ0115161.1 catechol 2,3-dioxygenase-like lactoylglutathione lyase family enzyme [Paenibacillus harenae]
MFKNNYAYSNFGVDDIVKAVDFYRNKLGLKVEEDGFGFKLTLSGTDAYVMPMGQNYQPAAFHILNFDVGNIEQAVAALKEKGIALETFAGMEQDELGIMRGKAAGAGPDMAIFKDPAGNMLAVVEL